MPRVICFLQLSRASYFQPCISYFSDALIKYHGPKQVIKEGIYLAYSSRGEVSYGKEGIVAGGLSWLGIFHPSGSQERMRSMVRL